MVTVPTDVSGGDSATILDAMRRAMDVSTHLQIGGQAAAGLSWSEAFYLATLGGAKGEGSFCARNSGENDMILLLFRVKKTVRLTPY